MERQFDPQALATALRLALARPLPGAAFHARMQSAARAHQPPPERPRPSAVLVPILAFESPTLLLIERAAGGLHGGQIAFPGGAEEPGDLSPEATALREAREEIGLEPEAIEVLGRLTPLTIAVSGFLVQPALGLVRRRPTLKPRAEEVARVLEVPLAELLDPVSKAERELEVRGQRLLVPCYILSGALVWGATAMMLAELEEILRRAITAVPE